MTYNIAKNLFYKYSREKKEYCFSLKNNSPIVIEFHRGLRRNLFLLVSRCINIKVSRKQDETRTRYTDSLYDLTCFI